MFPVLKMLSMVKFKAAKYSRDFYSYICFLKNMRIPRFARWLLYNSFFFLFIMFVLRIVLWQTMIKEGLPHTGLFKVFILGFRYDARIVAIVGLLLLIISFIKSIHPFETKRGKRISLFIWGLVSFLLCFFYAVDFANYGYLSQRLNASLLNYMEDTAISLSMVWQSYHVVYILFGILISFLLINVFIKFTYNKIAAKRYRHNKKSQTIWSIILLLVLALAAFGRVGQYPLRWSDAFALNNDYAANLALNPFQSFFSTLQFRKSGCDLAKTRNSFPLIASYLNLKSTDTLNYKRCVTFTDTASTHPNVVVVICESFSGYKSSMFGNPLNTTPYFNELCNNGIFFSRCFTPSYGTARGVWATLTGIPDVENTKTASRNPNAVNQHIIINDFTDYEKYYFIGGSTSWANIRGLLTNNIGNLHLFEQDDYEAAKIDVWGVSDKNMLLGANKTLSKCKKPFIAVLQTADNHHPYTIPDEDKAAFEVKNVAADTLRKYGFTSLEEFNAFRYTDFCFKHFIESAKKEAYFKNTVFVFVGDHGIPGNTGNMFPKIWAGEELSMTHVPLLFYAPGILKPERYNKPVSQIDILPTVAGICKVKHCNTSLGRNILLSDSLQPPVAFYFNPDKKTIGCITDKFFYTESIDNKTNERVSSVLNNDAPVITPAEKQKLKFTTEAFYETAKYMLLNNKKLP